MSNKPLHKNKAFIIIEVESKQFVKFFMSFTILEFLEEKFERAFLRHVKTDDGKVVFQCWVENINGLKSLMAESFDSHPIIALVTSGYKCILKSLQAQQLDAVNRSKMPKPEYVGELWEEYTLTEKFALLRNAIYDGKIALFVKVNGESVRIKLPSKPSSDFE